MPLKKRKCVNCKERKPVDQGNITPVGFICSGECAIEYRKTQFVKKHYRPKPRKRAGLSHQKDLTQAAFNKMRRLEELLWFKERGLEPYCISCLKTNMDWCCGHYKTRGSQPELAFDRQNTYLQCNKYCNSSLSGNISGNKSTIGFTKGLEHRFGESRANEILEYLNSNHELKKYLESDYKEMRKKFNARARQIEQKLKA